MRRDLPDGRVTFLFTDVEGSTKLLHTLGAESYAETLAEHRRVVRDACGRRGGVEVDTQGDAFFFVFPAADKALVAARMITEELRSGPITLRIGVHTGTPLLTDEGYVGEDVHFAARVAASAHGGQVVLSQETRALVSDGFPLLDLGEHRLKDIPEPVAIFQLDRGQFPPLKTISNTNLPRPATSFVGRERELPEVVARIKQGARLVSLTGAGGSGKTRLALEAATTLVPEYKGGVFWVGVASLRDSALVTETIAETLGAKDGLADHIGEREMLLLLDNLEQVIDAAPELSALLEACPQLDMLVTSRELLRVRGEVEYPVPPLAQRDAVALFCQRAQTQPADEIQELCRRLDSLPLAVELAAARTKVLSPAQILDRLAQRLDLLKGGRDVDPRQKTLRATIEWSYQLLSAEERRLFRRLSVFSGGCTLAAAEEVVDADLDTLQSLIEKSLVRFSNERYWMLETIREYAAEQLRACQEAPAACRRHADYFQELGAQAAGNLRGPGGRSAVDGLDQETHNLRVALAWFEEVGPIDALLSLTAALWQFWQIRGRWFEGRHWTEAALARSAGEQNKSRADVLRAAMALAGTVGDHEAARGYAEEALKIFRELDDQEGVASAMEGLGVIALELEEFEEASRILEAVVAEAAKAGARAMQAHATANLAELEQHRGDYASSARLTRDALSIYRDLGDDVGVSWTLCNLAYSLFLSECLDEAWAVAQESLGVARRIDEAQVIAWDVLLLAAIALNTGNVDAALRLNATLVSMCEATGLHLSDTEAALHGETSGRLSGLIGHELYAAALAEAGGLELSEIVDYATSLRF